MASTYYLINILLYPHTTFLNIFPKETSISKTVCILCSFSNCRAGLTSALKKSLKALKYFHFEYINDQLAQNSHATFQANVGRKYVGNLIYKNSPYKTVIL